MKAKAIETVYKGYRFRSRTEARWAVFFDTAGIEWMYEPEGFEMSDGTRYLPDFYLPESKTFFECKGIMSTEDLYKILMFINESDNPVVVGYPDMTFMACSKTDQYSLESKSNSAIVRCTECGGIYFLGIGGSWACRCCGAYDGNSYVDFIGYGDDKNSPYIPIITAKQSRFEYGETPQGVDFD